MRLAFDTSFLVATVLKAHPHHKRVLPWNEAVSSGKVEAQITWNAAAETWSVLTRLPESWRLSGEDASCVLDRLLQSFEPVEIVAATYQAAIRRCADRSLRSGALFDALHLASAEANDAQGFVTFNQADFIRLQTPESPTILVPPDPPAFSA